jgi:hypothetical protein
MRMISHFQRQVGGAHGSTVGVRYFSLECELAAMKGLRIPQVAVTLKRHSDEPDTQSVDPDPELLRFLDERRDQVGVRELLDRLAGRFAGRPIGDLAVTAAGLLPHGV